MVHLSMGVSNMKKFLINIAIFFAIVAFVDVSLGKIFHYLQWNIAGGRTGKEYYACKKANEDILIMGSSRAAHHYDSQIISDSLGMSCFNAGEDGNGIIMQYGRWKMISERYTPKLIIYDICSIYDVEENDNMAYVDRLKPYCGDQAVRDYVTGLYPLERLKLFSKMYCYNYKFFEILSDCRSTYDLVNGYSPLEGHMLQSIADRPMVKKNNLKEDNIKIKYLENLIKEADQKGTSIVFAISPSWRGGQYDISAFSTIIELAERYSIPFYNYIGSSICNNADYFKDSYHLNKKGASFFSQDLSRQLKNGEQKRN